jgi:hypothetical protein
LPVSRRAAAAPIATTAPVFRLSIRPIELPGRDTIRHQL